MAAASTSSLSSPFLLPSKPFSSSFPNKQHAILSPKKPSSTTVFAMRRRSEADHHDQNDRRSSSSSSNSSRSSGRLVDENMIVLRKRIHEMKMIERNYEPPAEWMDWEKSYYTSYDSMICEAMGFLQSYLMNSRPSLALGMIALVTLSVPTSSFVIMSRLMELTKGVLDGIH